MEKRTRNRQPAAFTRLELLIVVIILALTVPILIITETQKRKKAQRTTCVNNLKQIGTAYRVWPGDSDRYPAMAYTNNNGWRNALFSTNQGALCWTNYLLMTNELGQNPKVLLCPADDRKPASSFTSLKNLNISYFVGVGASDSYPQSLLGGDRNLGRGLTPSPDYGFSPANGLGNDVTIQTDSKADPISWTLKMHSKGDTNGAGNILLGDASVQQITSARLRTDYQPNALDLGNWPNNHVPTVPSFRLIFP